MRLMASLQPLLDEWWWCRDAAITNIATSLSVQYVALIDNFLPSGELEGVVSEVTTAYSNGFLSNQGYVGEVGHASADNNIRGDLVGFFEGKNGFHDDIQRKEGWGAGKNLARALEKMNTIVCELRDSSNSKSYLPGLSAVSTRSRAMVTCYPGQQRAYTKHCDNAVRNGRKLTAILYLNPHWTQQDGGELKIYPNYPHSDSATTYKRKLMSIFGYNSSNCSIGDNSLSIQPVANRLVLFWSDMRCPHEVLPTHKTRFAVTLWFIDGHERDQTAARNNKIRQQDQKFDEADGKGEQKLEEKGCEQSRTESSDSFDPSYQSSNNKQQAESEDSALSVPSPNIVTLLLSDSGEASVWNAQEQCMLFCVRFSDPSLVPHTLVDVVNKSVLHIHTADHAFPLIKVPIILPVEFAHFKIEEDRMTAKFSRKKKILSVRLYFVR